MEPLKPCPFCGNKNLLRHMESNRFGADLFTVGCRDCKVHTGECVSLGVASAAWNTRARIPREAMLAVMAAAWGTDEDPGWVEARMAALLDGTPTERIRFAGANRDARSVEVAHQLGYPGAKVPT